MMAPAELLPTDGSLAIFLFHGVVESSSHQIRNYTRKHLPVGEFEASLAGLARKGTPLSMQEVLSICRSGEAFPQGAFAITFDDGFENNLTVARPILEQFKIPATVYVTSRFVDQNAMSWIDRIEFAVENTDLKSCQLPWQGLPLNIERSDTKIALLDEIRRYVKSDPSVDIEGFIIDFFKQLDMEPIVSSDDPLDRKMSWRQVREWVAPGYIVGGHSHTHAILSFLDAEKLAWELDTSLGLLLERGGIATSHYSYPEGLVHCYSPAVIEALKERNIACSPTAIDGVNPPGTDPFHLRRIAVV